VIASRHKWILPLLALSCGLAALVYAQELPDGPGKELTKRMCSACHPITTVTGKRASKDQWGIIVDRMVGIGAKGTDDEIEAVIDYLAANFGPKK